MATRKSTPLKSEDVEPEMCTIDTRLHILSEVPFFTSLAPEEVLEVNRLFHEQGFAPGSGRGVPQPHRFVQ